MGERSGEDGLLAQAEIAPLTGLAESLGIDRNEWIDIATQPLPETLRLTMNHYDMEWTRQQLLDMGAKKITWSVGNEAYQLPFARGQAPRDGTRELLALLHDTGRVTRQEAASMLPILVLNPQHDELLLDLCAAPGSKATHAAERMAPSGVVVANEPISGRVNMLASNRGRLSLHNVIITQHDGRHVGRIPKPGFDAIVADVPCTGSATSRKNKDVWWSWSPKGGRTMFQLQVDIASRGAQLLQPGGLMVYSTCSIDPVENEAVIAELVRKCPWMEVVEIDESNVEGLVWHQGLTSWMPLDENGKVPEQSQDVPFFDERYMPPQEQELLAALPRTRRLYPQDNNTGGFYVALLRHREVATPEGVAKTFIDKLAKRREESGWESRLLDKPRTNRHTVHAAEENEAAIVMEQCQLTDAGFSWWKRGKRMAVAPKLVHDRIWAQETPNKRGDRWPGGTFHPLQVLHVGLPAFVSKNGNWRARQESIPLLYSQLSENIALIDHDVLMRLLSDEALEPDVVFGQQEPPQGAFLLRCMHRTGSLIINAWCGTRITLMLDKAERRLLSIRLGLEEEV
ncbi:MAG: Ribosomal RNA small subunit methyltransferase F [Candidatus Poseidoniaceae archaeon]|nr:MAG: Ribosomal RNA small subunit methyltransferase F [Candidatus Poseidoniaceae archaeon]